jgi:hypothetical protein
VVDTVLSMGKSFLGDTSTPLYLMTMGAPSITNIKGRTRLRQGENLPKVTTEPDLRFNDVCHYLKEWPPARFIGEQVAEARLEGGGVCLEGELCVGRDGVHARGPVRAPVIIHVSSGTVRRRVHA